MKPSHIFTSNATTRTDWWCSKCYNLMIKTLCFTHLNENANAALNNHYLLLIYGKYSGWIKCLIFICYNLDCRASEMLVSEFKAFKDTTHANTGYLLSFLCTSSAHVADEQSPWKTQSCQRQPQHFGLSNRDNAGLSALSPSGGGWIFHNSTEKLNETWTVCVYSPLSLSIHWGWFGVIGVQSFVQKPKINFFL